VIAILGGTTAKRMKIDPWYWIVN